MPISALKEGHLNTLVNTINKHLPQGPKYFPDDMITDQQINSIKILCNRLTIDLDKFINSGSKTYKDIQQISRKTAASMIKRLNQYQSSGENSLEIPVDLLQES